MLPMLIQHPTNPTYSSPWPVLIDIYDANGKLSNYVKFLLTIFKDGNMERCMNALKSHTASLVTIAVGQVDNITCEDQSASLTVNLEQSFKSIDLQDNSEQADITTAVQEKLKNKFGEKVRLTPMLSPINKEKLLEVFDELPLSQGSISSLDSHPLMPYREESVRVSDLLHRVRR